MRGRGLEGRVAQRGMVRDGGANEEAKGGWEWCWEMCARSKELESAADGSVGCACFTRGWRSMYR